VPRRRRADTKGGDETRRTATPPAPRSLAAPLLPGAITHITSLSFVLLSAYLSLFSDPSPSLESTSKRSAGSAESKGSALIETAGEGGKGEGWTALRSRVESVYAAMEMVWDVRVRVWMRRRGSDITMGGGRRERTERREQCCCCTVSQVATPPHSQRTYRQHGAHVHMQAASSFRCVHRRYVPRSACRCDRCRCSRPPSPFRLPPPSSSLRPLHPSPPPCVPVPSFLLTAPVSLRPLCFERHHNEQRTVGQRALTDCRARADDQPANGTLPSSQRAQTATNASTSEAASTTE
jgi:hypothetical protein